MLDYLIKLMFVLGEHDNENVAEIVTSMLKDIMLDLIENSIEMQIIDGYLCWKDLRNMRIEYVDGDFIIYVDNSCLIWSAFTDQSITSMGNITMELTQVFSAIGYVKSQWEYAIESANK